MHDVVYSCKSPTTRVDWITASAPCETEDNPLWTLGQRALNRLQREGENPSRWHSHGYRGWSSTGVRVGSRPDGVTLQLSGDQARDQWLHCFRAAVNVSRLDLAVDTHFHPPIPALASELYRNAGHVPLRNGRRPKSSLIVNSDGGATVYIGRRVSENYGRVYDKGIEQKTAPVGSWWRWEVELKGETALAVSRALAASPAPASYVGGFVAEWFRSRSGCRFASLDEPQNCILQRSSSSTDAKLRWLSSSVRPTIQRLIELVGRERVLLALGLSPTKPQ